MSGSAVKYRSLEEIWDRTVLAARDAWTTAADDDYHLGIFDAHMATLADLAIHLGRVGLYVELCQEFDGLSWPLGEINEG